MATGTYISIITLNASGLNSPTKRHRLAEWIKKQDQHICCLQETHFRPQTHIGGKWEDGKYIPCTWEEENWSSDSYARQNRP